MVVPAASIGDRWSTSPGSCATGASRAAAETMIWRERCVPLVITDGV